MNNILKSILGLTVASAVSITAHAAPITTTFSNQDDLVMLGFRATTGTGADRNLLVSLGTVSELLGSYNATFNLSSAISSTFGSDFSRQTLLWGAFGAENSYYNSLIASSVAPSLTAEQSAVTSDNAYGFVGIQGNLAGNGTAVTSTTGTASGSGSIYAGYAWASFSKDNTGSWASYNSGPGAFNYFSDQQNWTLGTDLKFALYDPNGASVATLEDLTAHFNTATGVVTVAAVPEPSTYALAVVGLMGLVVSARRRMARVS